jgi:hypothetical protein
VGKVGSRAAAEKGIWLGEGPIRPGETELGSAQFGPQQLTLSVTFSHTEVHCSTEGRGQCGPCQILPEWLLPHTEGQPGTLPKWPGWQPGPCAPCWQQYQLLPHKSGLQPPAARLGSLQVSWRRGVLLTYQARAWAAPGWLRGS